jgi:hypothetical protein
VFEGKCLKEGLRNGAEASISGSACPPSSPGARLSAGSALAVGQFGSLRWPISARSAVNWPTASCLIQKARSGFSGAGLIVATMKIYQ